MASKTSRDNYYGKDGLFSSEVVKKKYETYQTERKLRFERSVERQKFTLDSPEKPSSHLERDIESCVENKSPVRSSEQSSDSSLDEDQKSKKIEIIQGFYLYAAQIHAHVEFEFELLDSLIKDESIFERLPGALRKRIKYEHSDCAQFLLDFARIANRRRNVAHYEQVLGLDAGSTLTIDQLIEVNNEVVEVDNEAAPLIPKDETKKAAIENRSGWFESLLVFYPETLLNWIGFANIYRLLSRFFTLSWVIAATLEQQKVTDSYILESTTPAFNVLSLALFAGRFAVDVTTETKHVVRPTEGEKGVRAMERARMGALRCYKRSVNDVLWTLFNLLTNYAPLLNVPAPIVGWLLLGFLVFDVCWAWHKWARLEQQIKFQEEILQTTSYVNRSSTELYIELQLRELQCKRVKTQAEYIYTMVAASLLVASIGLISGLSSTPIAVLCGFLACAVAVAMYITSDQFGSACRATYERRRVSLDKETFSDRLTNMLDEDPECSYEEARIKNERKDWKTYGWVLGEALIVPGVIIGLYIFNWPAAVALTVAYVAYKILMSNQKVKEFVGKNVETAKNCFWAPASTLANEGSKLVEQSAVVTRESQNMEDRDVPYERNRHEGLAA